MDPRFRAAHARLMTTEQLIPGFEPETALERQLIGEPALRTGLAWGRPRSGHPEGSVGRHVGDILDAITEPPGRRRRELRFLALVHDAFKHRVRPDAEYSCENDHAVLARRFAERYTSDPRLLLTLELHDEAYFLWRTHSGDLGSALDALLARIPDLGLFLRFVELDSSTEGKDPRPLAALCAVARELGRDCGRPLQAGPRAPRPGRPWETPEHADGCLRPADCWKLAS
jgi:hypothetical protein